MRLPTGCGKTITAGLAARRWLSEGVRRKVFILCHETQLVHQFAREMKDVLQTDVAIEQGANRVSSRHVPDVVVLVERADLSVLPALRKLAASGPSPLGQIHALWTLDGLGHSDPVTIVSALKSKDPQVRANGYVVEVPHPELGMVKRMALPLHLNGACIGGFDKPAPQLGEHTQEVLTGVLGLSAAQIDELAAKGATTSGGKARAAA